MNCRPVAPTGHRASVAIVEGRAMPVKLPIYPESPEGRALAARRRAARISLTTLARAVGMTFSALSKLEEGSSVPESPSGWAELHSALDALGAAR